MSDLRNQYDTVKRICRFGVSSIALVASLALAAQASANENSATEKAGASPEDTLHPIVLSAVRSMPFQDAGMSNNAAEDEEDDTEENVVEEIAVIGSKIKGITSTAPVIIITAEDIELKGFTDIAEVLKSLPQNRADSSPIANVAGGGGSDSNINAFSGFATNGVNLRGMGTGSTLILVNGRRQLESSVAQGVTDISWIRIEMIESIHILTDGASAIYGSDAIAGVIDIRLKKDYEGFHVTAERDFAKRGGSQQRYSATGTYSWGSGRINGALSYSSTPKLTLSEFYDNRELYELGDWREFGGSQTQTQGSFGADQQPGQIFAAIPTGATNANGVPTYSVGDLIYRIPEGQDGTNLSIGDLTAITNADLRLNPSIRALLAPSKTFSFNLSAYQEVGEYEVNANFIFNRAQRVDSAGFTTGTQSRFRPPLLVYAENPLSPFDEPVFVAYAPRNEIERGDTFQETRNADRWELSTGITGPVPFLPSWAMDINANYGDENTGGGNLSALNFSLGRNIYTCAASGLVCDSSFLATATPNTDLGTIYNVFGDGSANTEQVFINILSPHTVLPGEAGERNSTGSYSWSMNADFSGPLFDLPGGTVQLATGIQHYRSRRGFRAPISDLSTFDPSSITPELDDRSKTTGIYAELAVPIFGADQDIPLIHKMLFSASARYTHDKRNGSKRTAVTNFIDFPFGPIIDTQETLPASYTDSHIDPKLGLAWHVTPDFKLRGTWGTSFSSVKGVTAFSDDQTFLAAGFGALIIFNATVPDGYDAISVATLVAEDLQATSIKTFTIGFDWNVSQVPGLLYISANLVGTTTDNAIGTSGFTLDEILADLDLAPSVLSDVTINHNGVDLLVLQVNDGLANQNRATNKSLDLQVSYSFDNSLGQWYTSVFATRHLKQDFLNLSGVLEDRTGTDFAPPRWKGRGDLTWKGNKNWLSGAWAVNMGINYNGSYIQTSRGNSRVRVGNLFDLPVRSYTTVDLSISWDADSTHKWLENTKVNVTIDDIFHADVPFHDGDAGFNGSVVNPRGRVINVRLNKSF